MSESHRQHKADRVGLGKASQRQGSNYSVVEWLLHSCIWLTANLHRPPSLFSMMLMEIILI